MLYHFAVFTIKVVTGMFLVGMAGSAIVVVVSFVEDFQVLIGKD
jgi:hypothetical protein